MGFFKEIYYFLFFLFLQETTMNYIEIEIKKYKRRMRNSPTNES